MVEQKRAKLRNELLKEEDIEKWWQLMNWDDRKVGLGRENHTSSKCGNNWDGTHTSPVCDAMPAEACHWEFATWVDFCKAVKTVSDKEIWIVMLDEERLKRMEWENAELHQGLTPIFVHTTFTHLFCYHQMGSFSISWPQSTPLPSQSGHNIFQGRTMQLATLLLIKVLALAIAQIRSHGHSKQISSASPHLAWSCCCTSGPSYCLEVGQSREAGGDEYAPYLLTPGTLNVGSAECYKCSFGLESHVLGLCLPLRSNFIGELLGRWFKKVVLSSWVHQRLLTTKMRLTALLWLPSLPYVHQFMEIIQLIPATDNYPEHYIHVVAPSIPGKWQRIHSINMNHWVLDICSIKHSAALW